MRVVFRLITGHYCLGHCVDSYLNEGDNKVYHEIYTIEGNWVNIPEERILGTISSMFKSLREAKDWCRVMNRLNEGTNWNLIYGQLTEDGIVRKTKK